MNIGKKINQLLMISKINKSDLSNKLGIARNTLDDYISNKTSPTAITIKKMSEILNVSPGYFFDDDTNEVHEPLGEYKNVSVDEEIKNISDSLKKIVNKIIAENKATI